MALVVDDDTGRSAGVSSTPPAGAAGSDARLAAAAEQPAEPLLQLSDLQLIFDSARTGAYCVAWRVLRRANAARLDQCLLLLTPGGGGGGGGSGGAWASVPFDGNDGGSVLRASSGASAASVGGGAATRRAQLAAAMAGGGEGCDAAAVIARSGGAGAVMLLRVLRSREHVRDALLGDEVRAAAAAAAAAAARARGQEYATSGTLPAAFVCGPWTHCAPAWRRPSPRRAYPRRRLRCSACLSCC
jgi:hypothetical protein